MEPRIQYAKTSDGVNIAYWSLGEGEPAIVQCPGTWSHTQRELELAERRQWFERMAQHRRFVKFDQRGSGLSDRRVPDLTVEAWVRDIEAVVGHAGLGRVALMASASGIPAAVSFAANHPEIVSHIILWSPSLLDGTRSAAVKALESLMDVDWELYTDALVLSVHGWAEGADRIAGLFREATTPDVVRFVSENHHTRDLTETLQQIAMPVLLLFRPNGRAFSEDGVRRSAVLMPNSRTVFLPGTVYSWYLDDQESVIAAIEEFIDGDGAGARTRSETGRFRTIMFTDIEKSTAITQELGDLAAHELVRAHNRIVRDALNIHGGSEIKHTGDGIMASFPSAQGAVACAIQIQQDFDAGDGKIRVRIGLNAGEPVAEEDDLFGTAVQLAARVCAQAEPGRILASNVVQELAVGRAFKFADRGETELKGFERPVRLYEVKWRDQ